MFKSDALSQLDKQAQQLIENKIKMADIASHDIKLLEERLRILSPSSLVCHVFDEDHFYHEDEQPPFSNKRRQHCLVWAWSKDTKRFELMYTLKEIINGDDCRILYTKKLIECDINIRILAKDHLAKFYEVILTLARVNC